MFIYLDLLLDFKDLVFKDLLCFEISSSSIDFSIFFNPKLYALYFYII